MSSLLGTRPEDILAQAKDYNLVVVQAQPAFSIRRAERSDGPSILDCLQAAFEAYREQYRPEGFAGTVLTPETLDQRFATMFIFVAAGASGKIVGTVAGKIVSEEEGHIRGMAVRPEWQGRGVAAALLAAIEAELSVRRCSRITLDTTSPLQRAIQFYERHGYHCSGRVTDFFGMPLFEYLKEL
jgi:GNAT superfamily N-acetyltransferase